MASSTTAGLNTGRQQLSVTVLEMAAKGRHALYVFNVCTVGVQHGEGGSGVYESITGHKAVVGVSVGPPSRINPR